MLHASRLRVEALDARARVEAAVSDPDRARPDGDLAGQSVTTPFIGSGKRLDDLVHGRVDAQQRRRVSCR